MRCSVVKKNVFLLFTVIMISSCVTNDSTEDPVDGLSVDYDKDCTTKIELRNGTVFEHPEDTDNLVRAESGCIKNYGVGSCLSKFVKTGKLSYYAICKRPNKK